MPPDRGIQASLRVSDTGPLDWDRRCICPGLRTLCRATKRPGHHRRSVVEEADRRGRPLGDPGTAANPDIQIRRLRQTESPHSHSHRRRGGWRPPRRARE
jgi:hypothetical protein